MYLYGPFLYLSFLLPQVQIPLLNVKIVDVILFLSIILFIAHLITTKKIFYNFEPVYVALLTVMVTSLMISVIHLSMIKLFVRFFGIVIIPCYFAYHGSMIFEKYKITFIKAYEFSLPVVLCLSILQTQTGFWYFNGSDLVFGLQNRAHGTFGNSAQMGATVSMGFLIYIILQSKMKRTVLFLIIMLCAVFLSGTRSAVICVLIASLLLLSRSRTGKSALLLLLCSLITITFYFFDRINALFLLLGDELDVLMAFYFNLEISSLNAAEYCFPISGNDFVDKSLGLRIEKAIFALKNTFEHQNYFGIGFGNCIGNSSDSLFFRLLNDGGIPLVSVMIVMIMILFFTTKILSLKIILLGFLGMSLFFDTLYFQGMTITWGLLIASHGSFCRAKKMRHVNAID